MLKRRCITLESVIAMMLGIGVVSGSVAGEPRQHVGLTLSVDRHSLMDGDAITLTSTVTSDSRVPLNLHVGSTTSGIHFQTARAFEVRYSTDPDGVYALAKRRYTGGAPCATGSRSSYVVLMAGAPIDFNCQVVFERVNEDTGRLIFPGVEYHLPWPCTVTIQTLHRVRREHHEYPDPITLGRGVPEGYFDRTALAHAPDPYLTSWVGELRSNYVSIGLGVLENP